MNEIELLEAHSMYYPNGKFRGIPVYGGAEHQPIMDKLKDEGFLETTKDLRFAHGLRWMLTVKGTQAVEVIRGKRDSLPYRAPNWFLAGITMDNATKGDGGGL